MTYLPLWLGGLTPEMVKKAKDELGETEDIKTQALKDLRRLINGEKDFRPLMEETFLLRFLRAKKFDVEKAFNNLRNFYTYKLRYSRILTDFKPSELVKVLEQNNLIAMPRRLEDGSSIGLCKLSNLDINSVSAENLMAAALVCIEVVLQEEASQVCGHTIIVDLDKVSLRLLKQFASPTLILRGVRAIQDCIPLRIPGIHLVNEPFFINLLLNLVKPLLSEKIKNRIQFYGRDLKSLHKKIPPELLPMELGGHLGPMDNTEFRTMVLNKEQRFEKINKYGFQDKKAQFIKKKSSRAFGLFQ